MPSKIRIRIGDTEIEYEGPESFLQKKLPELLQQLNKLNVSVPEPEGGKGKHKTHKRSDTPQSLAAYLKQTKAKASPSKRFLATAQWLHLSGRERITTADVSRAIKDAQQSRLSNASEFLRQNTQKGYCVKDGRNGFYVTDEGRDALRS